MIKIPAMADAKTKQKAMEAATDILGTFCIDSTNFHFSLFHGYNSWWSIYQKKKLLVMWTHHECEPLVTWGISYSFLTVHFC